MHVEQTHIQPGPRQIAVVTSSRADYAHLYWFLRELDARPACDVRLLVTGAHLSPVFGRSVQEIEADGFPIHARINCLPSADTDVAMGKAIGVGVLGFTDVLSRLRPDLLVLVADRYEMLAPACAALTLRIAVAHIEGGERSEGAIDQTVRDALTMMSHLHFVGTQRALTRLLQLGEEPWRVHRVGAGSLDHLRHGPRLSGTELETRLGFRVAPEAIIASFHAVTVDQPTTDEADVFFEAMRAIDGQIIWCYPNADAGSRAIIDQARRFCRERPDAHLIVNVHPTVYWSLLDRAALICGNSSSGIIESTAAGLRAVNVGKRQQGRETALNIETVPAEVDAIRSAIARAREPGRPREPWSIGSPYGDGHAGRRTADVLANVALNTRLRMKRLEPQPCVDAPPETPDG